MCRSARADRARRAAAALLLPLLALTGCANRTAPIAERFATAPPFDVAAFFSGRTSGEGTLDIVLRDPEPVRVEGRGQLLVDGTLVLEQVVARGDRPLDRRRWRIRQVAPDRWRGYLSDATDLVDAQVTGNRLTIRYPMRGGLIATQHLHLQPDGRTALNRMTITKLGIAVGTLDETIRKLD